jgi:hypothetical protein
MPRAAGCGRVVGRWQSRRLHAARCGYGSGHRGLVATDSGRMVMVMTATARQHPAAHRYARLPDESPSARSSPIRPESSPPRSGLASPLIVGGGVCATTFAPPLPRLPEALSNLGFGRNGAYGIQPTAPRCRSSAIAVRVAAIEHLDTIARLTWSNYSTAPHHRYSHPARTVPSATWPPSTAPCTTTAPSTFWPPSTGATPTCSPSS